jgi:hypothetical protein
VLFWLPATGREANLHTRLSEQRVGGYVPVATAVPAPDGPGPVGPVWALHAWPGRWALLELPCRHGDPHSPYNPAPYDPDVST